MTILRTSRLLRLVSAAAALVALAASVPSSALAPRGRGNARRARLPGRRASDSAGEPVPARPARDALPDRARLRDAGFTDRDIWDIAAVAAFFNMSNRVASATDMRPNSVYHGQAR